MAGAAGGGACPLAGAAPVWTRPGTCCLQLLLLLLLLLLYYIILYYIILYYIILLLLLSQSSSPPSSSPPPSSLCCCSYCCYGNKHESGNTGDKICRFLGAAPLTPDNLMEHNLCARPSDESDLRLPEPPVRHPSRPRLQTGTHTPRPRPGHIVAESRQPRGPSPARIVRLGRQQLGNRSIGGYASCGCE